MKNTENFKIFFLNIHIIQDQIEPYRFAEMLIMAAVANKENAQLFIEALEDLGVLIENQDALKKAEEAARKILG
jgi:hypothetical protein